MIKILKKIVSAATIFVVVFSLSMSGNSASLAEVLPAPNPELEQSCGLDIALVIDSSGSVNSTELAQMKTAFTGFVNALLPTTPTQFSVTDFDFTAVVRQSFTDDAGLINAAINSVASGGATNWEDGLIKAQSTLPNRSNPNLVIFASDGNPNKYGNNQGPGNGFFQPALDAAITVANNIKNSGTRIITLGIGETTGTESLKPENLKAISSDDAYYGVADFLALTQTLQQLAAQLCGGTLTVTKNVDGIATAGWDFQIGGTFETTGLDGKTNPVGLSNGTYDVVEILKPGYSFVSAVCTGADNNGAPIVNGVSGIQITTDNIVSCVFNNTTDAFCGDGTVNQQSEQCDDGNDTDNDGCSAACQIEYVNISAYKVICEDETDLPNWGTSPGGPDISSNTAGDFIANSQGRCQAAADWDFQWGFDGQVQDQQGDFVGYAGGGWKNFDSQTGAVLPAKVQIEDLEYNNKLWFREVLKQGYIPFSSLPSDQNQNDVSAEFYCNNDVLNYDNYEWIENPQFGETYYCVGFNVPLQEPIPGCTDPAALNYNPDATVDDGSCEYPPEPIPGCTDPAALNYNPDATVDDGSCEYPPEPIPGCTDPAALNYNPDATVDDGSCEYPPQPIPGCTNPTALNYNPAATVDNGSCLYPGGFCGDLAVNQSWEQCDDGNLINGDGCSADCKIETTPQPYCGDGIINGNEECDGLAGVAEGQTCNASCVLGASTCNLDLDVMMIMDVSGSMGYENPSKLSQAKIAANSFLDYLRSGDQSGLVSFGTNASLKKTLSNDHAGTQLIINSLTAYGATNIGEAIDIANGALLSSEQNPDALKIETLLTDGMANQPNGNGSGENAQDIALVISKSLEAAAGGIKMFVIGLGTGVNETMLKNIAANTGGNYYFAPTANDLNGVFNQIAFDNCVIEPPAPEISIFNVRILSVSADSAIVSWYTNIPATSRVVYDNQPVSAIGGEPNYGYVFSTPEQDSVNKVIFHSVTITGLVPGTTYFWRPISHGSPIKVGDELSFTTSISEESDVESCVGEGESIPVIANLPACCAGLEMIPPKEEQIVGIFGICTANCGNGICNKKTESYLNCPKDCEMAGEIGAEGAENIAGAMAEQSDLVKLLAASGRFINDRWLVLVIIAAVLFILYWMIFGRKRKNKNTI